MIIAATTRTLTIGDMRIARIAIAHCGLRVDVTAKAAKCGQGSPSLINGYAAIRYSIRSSISWCSSHCLTL